MQPSRPVNTAPDVAKEILPFISFFGKFLPPACISDPQLGRLDFLWEREWRWPHLKGKFLAKRNEVFIGLCPDEEIGEFERLLRPVKFVDPRRDMRWYSTQLLEMKNRCNLSRRVFSHFRYQRVSLRRSLPAHQILPAHTSRFRKALTPGRRE